MKLLSFPDLTQGKAADDEKNPTVGSINATFGVKAKIYEEMYVLC